jgi:hypothetical protein
LQPLARFIGGWFNKWLLLTVTVFFANLLLLAVIGKLLEIL